MDTDSRRESTSLTNLANVCEGILRWPRRPLYLSPRKKEGNGVGGVCVCGD